MTWPAGAVTTTNVDAGTDNPQNVTAYAQGLLDDSDAAAALLKGIP